MDKEKKEEKKTQDQKNNEEPQLLNGYVPEWYIPGAYIVEVLPSIAV